MQSYKELLRSILSEHSWKTELRSVSIPSSTSTSSNCLEQERQQKQARKPFQEKSWKCKTGKGRDHKETTTGYNRHKAPGNNPLARRWSENREAAVCTTWIWRKLKKHVRRKFRSQTPENMDRWKSRGGKSHRRKEKKKEDQRRERVRRKKMQVREP